MSQPALALDAFGREVSAAVCCWCRSHLVKLGASYWCPTTACNLRQRQSAVGVQVWSKEKKSSVTRYLWVPTPYQAALEQATGRYRLGGGAAGPGKSTGGRWMLYRRAMRIQGYEALVLRRTFPELEKTHLRRMAQECELLKKHGVAVEFLETKRVMKFKATDALIECGHMEDDDAVQKYLSTEYDDILADEGSTFNPKPLLELSTRARSTKPQVVADGGARFLVLTNPGGPSHQTLVDFFIDKAPDFDEYPALKGKYDPEQWQFLPARLEDNPYLKEDYETDLAVLSKWRYEQLRHGDWRVIAGQFFGDWAPSVHVRELALPSDIEYFASLDWGYSSPGCVLWWACLPDGHYHIVGEWKYSLITDDEIAAGIHAKTRELGIKRLRYIAADPAIWARDGRNRGQSRAETLQRLGLPMRKSDNDRLNGWPRIHALLRPAADGIPWLTVSPNCRYLIRTMPLAQSDKSNPEDVDTNGDDHALDTLRYGAMSRPSPSAKASKPPLPRGAAGHLLSAVRSRSSVPVVGANMVR